jgi:DNA-binding transcriptional LysR family regulator
MFVAVSAVDIELAKTFLEIVSTGSFMRAAERLNVGQTTISARIRTLEAQLGRPLFVRNKSGASLTPAGEQFLRYAPTVVQLWQRARYQVAVPPGRQAVLTIGSEISLWQTVLLDWVKWIRRHAADIALRVHVDVPSDLIDRVASGVVDIAIMYAPQFRPGLTIDLIAKEELVFVTTDRKGRLLDGMDYVHVDWGPDFMLGHGATYPDTTPNMIVNLGPLGLDYILSVGGAGYFRRRMVEPHIKAGRLKIVAKAPRFSYPIYVTHSANTDRALLKRALTGLRQTQVGSKKAPNAARG